jgi:hypothetical protein
VPTIFSAKPSRPHLVERKNICWPRDLLPLDIPTANIYTYGYDADVIGTLSKVNTSGLTLTQVGQNMMVDFNP